MFFANRIALINETREGLTISWNSEGTS